ncbi:MAG TPA: hypothetical protein VFJ59_10115, partial [Pseudolabrys sp.]|nr:hypothetical protein [Pseudolabrys sp.]
MRAYAGTPTLALYKIQRQAGGKNSPAFAVLVTSVSKHQLDLSTADSYSARVKAGVRHICIGNLMN